MKKWLGSTPSKEVFSLLPHDLKQKSSFEYLKELNKSRKSEYTRKRFYKLKTNDQEIIHLTYAHKLDNLYENSAAIHKAFPSYTCKPLFIIKKDEYSLFGQEFFEGQAIDDLYNESKIDETDVSKILTKVQSIFGKIEKPSSIKSAKEEFNGFCEIILENDLFSEVDLQILEKEVFPVILKWIDTTNPTIRWSQGDLAARNILVNNNYDFKIIDCEFACKTHFHQEDWIRLSKFSVGKFSEHPFVSRIRNKITFPLNLINLLKQTHLNRFVHKEIDYNFYLNEDAFDTFQEISNFGEIKSIFIKAFSDRYEVVNDTLKKVHVLNSKLQDDQKNLMHEIDELNDFKTNSFKQIKQLQEVCVEYQEKLSQRENKIFRMQHSFSWKITSPLRFLRRYKEKLLSGFPKMIHNEKRYISSAHSKNKRKQTRENTSSPFELKALYSKNSGSKRVKSFDPKCLQIIWLIPDFGKGSGGHSNIFRMIYFLEKFGHKNIILICGKTHHGSTEKAKKVLCDNFFKIDAKVHQLLNPKDFKHQGDALVCTSYDTCYYGRSVSFIGKRFYFVQDFEPDFSPKGSYYYLAKATYGFGMHCITNGRWMADKVVSEGGKCAGWFQQAFDPAHYYPLQKNNYHNEKTRIAAYIRFETPRRLSELIVFALNILSKERNDFEVMFFGDNQVPLNAHFPNKILGVLSHSKLGDLYRSCDIGCVFSGTNYSLIPIEMMAAGLPVVEFDGENIRSTFPSETICLAKPNPESIKEALSFLISNPARRKTQAEKAIDFVKEFSWHSSAKSVEKAFLNVISSQNES